MRMHFRPLGFLVRKITRDDWEAYRDFYKGLRQPRHFTALMEGQNLDSPETYDRLFSATIDKDSYIMFGAWNGGQMVAQTSLFFEDTENGRRAVFAGSERADAWRGKGLGDELYKARFQHLNEIDFSGAVTASIHPDNKDSLKAARRNGFVETGEVTDHGYLILSCVILKDAKGGAFEVETGFGPETDERMRILFIITEPGNNEAADDLIFTALGKIEKIPLKAANKLPGTLINPDRSIPPLFREAIRAAVETKYLQIRGPSRPSQKPDMDFMKRHFE